MKRVLFVTYGGGHVAMLLPVIQALRATPGFDVQVLGLTTAGPVLTAAGIPHLGFRDFVTDAPALGHGQRLAAGLPVGPVALEETVAYLGASYADLETKLGPTGAAEAYAAQGRQVFDPEPTLAQIICTLGPDLVVATNSPRAERAAIHAARASGVPAVCLVDLFALDEVAWIGQAGYADRVCVLSEGVATLMRTAGRRPDEIVVTGNPAFDRLAAPAAAAAGAALRQAHGWDGHQVLLWASQAEPHDHPFFDRLGDPTLPSQVDAVLLDAFAQRPDWRLAIRLHPSETRELGPLPPAVHASPRSEDLAALLHAVDAVLTFSSTVGLEAALVGKPVIQLTASLTAASAPYAAMGLALGVPSVADLPAAVDAVFDGPWRPAAAPPAAGGATARVTAILADLLYPKGV